MELLEFLYGLSLLIQLGFHLLGLLSPLLIVVAGLIYLISLVLHD